MERAVEMQDVEDLEHRRMPVIELAAEAAAKAGEVRAPVGAQADQLAVERHPTIAERARDRRQLGELLRALASVARADRDRAAVVAKLGAATVPLDLERPGLAVGYVARAEQHRRHECRLLLAVVHGVRA